MRCADANFPPPIFGRSRRGQVMSLSSWVQLPSATEHILICASREP
jgi:hypothetical protein